MPLLELGFKAHAWDSAQMLSKKLQFNHPFPRCKAKSGAPKMLAGPHLQSDSRCLRLLTWSFLGVLRDKLDFSRFLNFGPQLWFSSFEAHRGTLLSTLEFLSSIICRL